MILKPFLDFVEKMLPVIDMFREAPLKVVADTEVEKTMHNTFGALLNAIMIVIEKYGFKEFTAEEGQKLDAAKHQIAEVVEGEEEGLVVTTLRPGMLDAEGEVLR